MSRSVTLIHAPARVASTFDPRTAAVVHGIAASVMGAATIAIFFLVVDTLRGHPLFTPAALGARLFWGQPLEAGQPIPWIVVLGFTAMHGGVFLGFGMVAANEFALRWRNMTAWGFVTLSYVLFMSLQATFLTFGLVLLDPGAPEFPGIGEITTANFLAAAAMTSYLAMVDRAARHTRPELPHRPAAEARR
jgi:hypothetical protein